MKKFLAILLALTLALSLGAALAEDGPAEPAAAGAGSTEPGSFTFLKHYNVNGDVFPAETLEFDITACTDPANPDKGTAMITIGDVEEVDSFAVTGIDTEIKVDYPSYSKAGVYRYTIKEKEGKTQGVTYDTKTEVNVAILVQFNDKGKLEIGAAGVVEESDGTKNDTIANIYDLGGNDVPDDPDDPGDNPPGTQSLRVTKTVSGNLADPEKVFTVHVTLTAEKDKAVLSTINVSADSQAAARTIAPGNWNNGVATIDVYLKHGATVTFDKIPAGITYAVAEDAQHLCAGDTPTEAELNGEEGYLATYEAESGAIAKGQKPEAKITNTKQTEVKTGITLDSLPYIGILALVVIGGIVLFLRRRRHNED